MKQKNTLSLLLFITTIALGIYSYLLRQDISRLTDTKNFRFEWQNGQEVLASYWKEDNKLADQYFDANFDYNYEIIRAFTTYGKVYSTSFDRNENGVLEKTDFYNVIGEKVGYSLDKDEDGVPEEFVLLYNKDRELQFIDENRDGKYEKITVINKSKRTELIVEKLFE